MPITTEEEPEDIDDDAPARVRLPVKSIVPIAEEPTLSVRFAHYRYSRYVASTDSGFPSTPYPNPTVLLVS